MEADRPLARGGVGDTVNLAARLEAQAPVGGVVIGAETPAALPAAVVERLPPLEVKGKDEPVEAYLRHRLGTSDSGPV